ncbi:MAG: hypothetical protein ABI649_00820 [Gaiellaceae bacterium]
MRHDAPVRSYATGTKVDSHRSRADLARLLARHGANGFVVIEDDANGVRSQLLRA